MKSWISFLLPDDEYKKNRMLYFYSEGSIVLFLSLIGMMMLNKYLHISTEVSLLFSIAIFLIYVSGRYILSGIEYTDIATEGAYRKEVKQIFVKTGSFTVIFILLYILFVGMPNTFHDWVEVIGLLLTVSFIWFITSFISLKRSYNKNKELL